jgi:hypothetical protein
MVSFEIIIGSVPKLFGEFTAVDSIGLYEVLGRATSTVGFLCREDIVFQEQMSFSSIVSLAL